jgi:HSP20 family protein
MMQGCGIISINYTGPTLPVGESDMTDENAHYDQPEYGLEIMRTESGMVRRWVVVRHTTAWHPPTDVYESEDQLIVVVEIAGMRNGDFNVTLQGQRLIISGMRQRVAGADCAYHQLEIPFGEFRTVVTVPWPVSRDEVTASYRDGFLRVELPHAPAQTVQIVNVDIQDSDDENPAES